VEDEGFNTLTILPSSRWLMLAEIVWRHDFGISESLRFTFLTRRVRLLHIASRNRESKQDVIYSTTTTITALDQGMQKIITATQANLYCSYFIVAE
jgi:hypothetical protein